MAPVVRVLLTPYAREEQPRDVLHRVWALPKAGGAPEPSERRLFWQTPRKEPRAKTFRFVPALWRLWRNRVVACLQPARCVAGWRGVSRVWESPTGFPHGGGATGS